MEAVRLARAVGEVRRWITGRSVVSVGAVIVAVGAIHVHHVAGEAGIGGQQGAVGVRAGQFNIRGGPRPSAAGGVTFRRIGIHERAAASINQRTTSRFEIGNRIRQVRR